MSLIADNSFYFDTVKECIKAESPCRFSCGHPNHVAVFLIAMFQHVKESVSIFVESLDSETFQKEELTESLRGAIYRGIKIKVFSQTENCRSEFAKVLEENKSDNVYYKFVPKYKDEPTNFILMDQKAYWYKPERNECKAVGCGNEPDTCMKLLDNFYSIWCSTL